MAHLTPAELHDHPDLIAGGQELACLIEFGLIVMRVDAVGDLNLLQLDGLLLLLGFLFALLLLKAVLAVVHDLADRRLRLGSNQNQIHILVVSQSERLAGTHDPERLSLCVDDPNLPYINSLIDESLGLLCIRAYWYAPPLACLILFLIFRKEISRAFRLRQARQ